MPVNLTHLALRTSKTISEKVKTDGGGGYFASLGNKFNDSLEIVDNMPLGPEPLIIPSSEGTYKVRLQHTCNTVAKDKSALVIINYKIGGMSPTHQEIQDAKHSSTNEQLAQKTDEGSQNLLVGIEAVKACDRPKPPLIWLNSRFDYVSDDKENIKAMMRGSKDFIGCDLITTPECVAGIEADLVIHLGSSGLGTLTGCMSRCRGQFVQIK